MTYRILSIDGGGVRGVIPARILTEIEERAKKPISELFDLVVGTSTGGIIACGVTKKDPLKASQIIEFYREQCPKIFKVPTLWDKIKNVNNIWGPKYDRRLYDDVTTEFFGDSKVSECICKMAVPTFSLSKGIPYYFSNVTRQPDTFLRDVASACGSAPTYFNPKVFKDIQGNNQVHIDGGIYANDPVTLGISLALVEQPGLSKDDIFIVSLGTGNPKFVLEPSILTHGGIFNWMTKADLLDTIMDASSHFYNQQLAQVFQDSIRIQFELTPESSSMDNATSKNMDLLISIAEDYIQKNSSIIDNIVKRTLFC